MAITTGLFIDRASSRKQIEEAWPSLCKDLGLVDDKTGTNTYTIQGFDLYKWVEEKHQEKFNSEPDPVPKPHS